MTIAAHKYHSMFVNRHSHYSVEIFSCNFLVLGSNAWLVTWQAVPVWRTWSVYRWISPASQCHPLQLFPLPINLWPLCPHRYVLHAHAWWLLLFMADKFMYLPYVSSRCFGYGVLLDCVHDLAMPVDSYVVLQPSAEALGSTAPMTSKITSATGGASMQGNTSDAGTHTTPTVTTGNCTCTSSGVHGSSVVSSSSCVSMHNGKVNTLAASQKREVRTEACTKTQLSQVQQICSAGPAILRTMVHYKFLRLFLTIFLQ